MVRTEHVRTLFDSTQSQESKTQVCAHEFYTALRIKTHLDNTLYLSQLPVVRSELVRTLFDSTQSQESKSEDHAGEFYTALRIKTIISISAQI